MADLQAIANANADLRYGAQQSAIERKLAELGRNTELTQNSLNEYGQKGVGVVDNVYNLLDTKLGENRAQNQKDLGTQVDIIGRGYRDATNVQKAGLQSAEAAMANLYKNMGGQYAADPSAYGSAMAGVRSTVDDIIGRNAMDDATTTGDLRNWSAQMDSILGKGQANAKQQRASAQTSLQTSLMDALGQNQLEGARGRNDLNASLTDMLNERGAFLTSEMARLADEQWQREFQQAQLAQQAAQAQAELDARAAALADERENRTYLRGKSEKDDSAALARQALLDARYADETKYGRDQDALKQANWLAEHGDQTAQKQAAAKAQIAQAYYDALNDPARDANTKGLQGVKSLMEQQGLYSAAGIDPSNDPMYRSYFGQTPYGQGVNATASAAMNALRRPSSGQGFAGGSSGSNVISGAANKLSSDNWFTNAFRGTALGRR